MLILSFLSLNGCIYFFILAQPQKDGEDQLMNERQHEGEDEGGEC